jgi:hypothetical protein
LRKIHGRASGKFFEPFRTFKGEANRMSGCKGYEQEFSTAIVDIEKPSYLQMKTKDLWRMDLEKRKALLTDEEERFLLMIFRSYKSSGELDNIVDIPFGELFWREADNIFGK